MSGPSGYENSAYLPGPTAGYQSGLPQPLHPFPPQDEGVQPPYLPPVATDGSVQKIPEEGRDGEGGEYMPSAPPKIEGMEKIEGYNNLSFVPDALPPPTYEDSQGGLPPERQPLPTFAQLTTEQAREAVLEYVSEHCCYGKRAARNMIIEGINCTNAFHYTLETFCEKRETSWVFQPYDGISPIDGPQNGRSPQPWDIPVEPLALFRNSVAKVEVPHTAIARKCHECNGCGKVRCYVCWGRGRVICNCCCGSGRLSTTNGYRPCYSCSGVGTRTCPSCSGCGKVTCRTCRGMFWLKFYVELVVTWTTYSDKYIYEETNLPDELICQVGGETAFEEQMPRVWPISHFPSNSINSASKSLIQKHATSFPLEKILHQRQTVRVVPVSVVSYSYKNERGEYIVYGLECKVYFPDYPAQCCWGCEIL